MDTAPTRLRVSCEIDMSNLPGGHISIHSFSYFCKVISETSVALARVVKGVTTQEVGHPDP